MVEKPIGRKGINWSMIAIFASFAVTVVTLLWTQSAQQQATKDAIANIQKTVDSQGRDIEHIEQSANAVPVLTQGFMDLKEQLVQMNTALTRNQDNIMQLIQHHK